MVITQYGRVEVDPMRLPQAASMRTGLEDTFQSRLQEAWQQTERAEAPAPRQPEQKVESKPAEARQAPRAEAEPDEPDAEPTATPTSADPVSEQPQPVADETAAQIQPNTHWEEAERRVEAGKGSASSQTFTDVEAAGAAPTTTLPTSAQTLAALGAVQAAAAARSQSAAPVTATVTRTPIDAVAAAKTVAAAKETPGYRTMNAQSVNLLEQARDSVFKQILFKLGKDGGEMRMRLEPPELGELDLHMVVEKGGNLRLSIGADRPEMQQLLAAHLDELKQTLQQNGFAVTHAEVRAQSDGAGRNGQRDQHEFDIDTAPGDDDAVAAASSSGPVQYITAQGLDFWV